MQKLMNRLRNVLSKHDQLRFAPPVDLPDNLRPDFRTFYEATNPAEYHLSWFLGDFSMPGFQGLDALQLGYATNAIDGKRITDWPEDKTVFADTNNNPFSTNLTNAAPIHFSRHGMGHWKFEIVAETLPDLLGMLVCWKEVEHARGGETMNDDFEYLPSVFEEFTAACQAEGISGEFIKAIIAQQ